MKRSLLTIALLISIFTLSRANAAEWLMWGGPKGDFKVEASGLAEEWPDEGPKSLWSKDLGEGYSAILFENDRLYTMFRADDKEHVVCMSAKNGKKLWDHKYDSPVKDGHVKEFGNGPRATPLIVGDRLYAIGVSGKMCCLDKKTGKKKWSHDLWEEFKGNFLNHGYSSSPVAYKNNIIALVGGEGASIVAFDAKTGKVKWKKHDFKNSYSTAEIIKIDGKDQMLCYMAKELISIDPANGELLWKYDIGNQWGQNICQPIYEPKSGILFITAVQAGCRGLKLEKADGKYEVKEAWTQRRPDVHHSNAILIGDTVYTSTGGRGPGLFYAVNIKTGETTWKERGFSKATCVYGDGKFIILDEDGNLGLAVCTPKEFKILAQSEVLTPSAWTVPTLIGHKVFVRDSKKIKAFDLSIGPSAS
jgi:outer membrane protein assembly factor BamB